jgi:lipoprotein-anchoring transpeptidase ErfK/SrfK
MSVARRTLRHFTVAALSTLLVAGGAASASAQDLFSFLWSGGSRQTVSFPASYAPRQVIVSFGDRKLYWIYERGAAISYPIAVPREKSRWSGTSFISQKRVNPDWTPTAEMRRENPKLPAHVPGGHPLNPLGVRALYLGSSMYRIHGTDAPWTIGTAVSKGCIRMYNEDVLDLYPRVPTGTRVTVTWKKYS